MWSDSRKVKGLGSAVCKWYLHLDWNLMATSVVMGEQYFLTKDEERAKIKPTTNMELMEKRQRLREENRLKDFEENHISKNDLL